MTTTSSFILAVCWATAVAFCAPVDAIAKPKPKKLVKVWESDSTFRVPESVLYDPGAELIYVANIDGKSDELDGSGFISTLTLDGKIANLRWATGLNAPKGMGLHKGKLYVTDIYRLVVIDVTNGQVIKSYDAVDQKKAFLNDVTVTKDGTVYVTDSRFDQLYRLKDGQWEVILSGEQLNRPNGVMAERSGTLLIGSTKTGALRRFDPITKTFKTIADGMAATDGIVSDGGKGVFVSDWNGQVFQVEPNGEKVLLLDTRAEKINAADITFVKRGRLLLVPTFFKNRVVAYRYR